MENVADRRGRPLDVLGLDTCYGGSAEKLWEFREAAQYVTAAPGLIYSPGLRWDQAFAECARGTPAEVVTAVTRRGMPPGPEWAVLCAVHLTQLQEVVGETRRLAAWLGARIKDNGPLITYARSRAASWGRRNELCDLRSWAGVVASGLQDRQAATQAAALQSALDRCIKARWSSAAAADPEAGGLGVYFPPTFEAVPPSYGALGFAAESGWYAFLGSYWEWVSSLVVGGTHPG